MVKIGRFLQEQDKEKPDTDNIPDEDVLTQMGEFFDSLEFEEGSPIEDKILKIYDAFTDALVEIDPEELDEKSLEEFFDILDALDIDPKELDIDPEDLKESKIILEWVKKWVIRKGKKVKKLPKREGFKAKDGRYVRMSAAEKMKRKRGAKKGARKAKVRMTQALRKRKKSMKKRKSQIGN